MTRKKRYTEVISIILSKELRDRLIDVTDKKEISISEYVRDAVEARLDDDK